MLIQQLDLRFEPDTDGTGELFASARRDGFSGAGSAWFSEKCLLDFGARLPACFPLPPGADIRIEGGYWLPGGSPPRLAEILVGVRVYPVGALGAIGVRLELGDGQYEHQRPESRGRACFELMASYEEIQRFGAQVVQLLRSPGGIACLFQDAA